jgi:hypothetical protein
VQLWSFIGNGVPITFASTGDRSDGSCSRPIRLLSTDSARFGFYLFQKVRFEIVVSNDSLDPIVEEIIKGGKQRPSRKDLRDRTVRLWPGKDGRVGGQRTWIWPKANPHSTSQPLG